jgi:hypothetical protein
MWTINNFPTYADLSRWPTMGVKACPCCMYSTRSKWLKHGKKYRYMGHKRWLPMNYPLRRNRRTFDGKQEFECAPEVPSEDEILRQLERMAFGDESAGKTPNPTKLTKKDRKKKKKKKKKKREKRKKRGRGRQIKRKQRQQHLICCGRIRVFFLGCRIRKIIC